MLSPYSLRCTQRQNHTKSTEGASIRPPISLTYLHRGASERGFRRVGHVRGDGSTRRLGEIGPV